MTSEQRAEMILRIRDVEKARRKLRKLATSIWPKDAEVRFARRGFFISAKVVSHSEEFEGLHARDTFLNSYRVNYAEIVGYQKKAKKK